MSRRTWSRRASATSFASTSSTSGTSSSTTYTRFGASRCSTSRVSSPRRARATAFVVGVGHALQLVEHEARHEEVVAEQAGAGQRQQLPVHHRRRVDEEPVGVVVRAGAHERARREPDHREQLFATGATRPDSRSTCRARAQSPPMPVEADRRSDEQRERHRDREAEHRRRCHRRACRASSCGSGTRSDRPFGDPDRAFEEPAEDAAEQIARRGSRASRDAGQLDVGRPPRSLPIMKPAAVSSTTVKSRDDLDEHEILRPTRCGPTGTPQGSAARPVDLTGARRLGAGASGAPRFTWLWWPSSPSRASPPPSWPWSRPSPGRPWRSSPCSWPRASPRPSAASTA